MQDLTTNPHYRAALLTTRTLHEAGYQAFYAGGCVRDLLLGLTPKDFDVATSATPDQVLALFPKTFAVGAHFGVILVMWEEVCQPESGPTGPSPKDIPIEVATFRHDGAYSDGRRPDAVRFSSTPADDVHRRDFTINGMLLDPLAFEQHLQLHRARHAQGEINSLISTEGAAGAEKPGSPASVLAGVQKPASSTTAFDAAVHPALLDLVHGQADLAAHLIRAIGDPELRFAEDKLRMLRAVRFAARLNFTVEPRTARAIQQHAAEIHAVSPERIREELTRILTEGGARRGFELLDTVGLLPHILPEVARLKGVPQPPEYHPEGDVWTHTLLLLQNLPHAPKIPEPTPHSEGRHSGTPSSPLEGRHSGAQLQNLSISPAPATTLRVPHSSAQTISGVNITPTLAWGALLHDIGKPATYTPPDPTKPGDRIRFNNHVDVGVAIAEHILARLRFSNDDTAQILALIKNHMRFGDILHMKHSTLRRFLRLPRFPEHLALHWLDVTAAHNDLRLYAYALAHYLAEPPANLRPAPLLTGRDLIAAGYPPPPPFKPPLTPPEDAQLEAQIQTTAEALALIHHHFPLPTPPKPLSS